MSFLIEITESPVLLAEVAIIFTVFCFQVFFFFKTKLHCKELATVFTNKLRLKETPHEELNTDYGNDLDDTADNHEFDDLAEYESQYLDENNEVHLLESDSSNIINYRIKAGINNYLINNFGGTVSYSIIKDVIDREIDAKDHQITQLVPIPLYLGLAATIIGIIFGLFAMPGMGSEDMDLAGVDILINGVKIAMFASLSGLFWTIILSSYVYSNASNKVLEDKNEQLTYLQEQLLPVILRAEDTGLIGLKNSIDNFSKFAATIVSDLKSVSNQTAQNLKLQQDTIHKIEKLNVTSISKTNLELFSKLERNMDSFRQFSTYIDSLAVIAENLNQFSIRSNQIEQIADKIRTNVQTSNSLTEYLVAHTTEIKNMGENARQAVDSAEQKMAHALESLANRTSDNTNQLAELSDNLEARIADILTEFNRSIQKVTEHHIDVLTSAYNQAIPRFNELENLSLIKKNLESLTSKLETLSTQGVESIPEIKEKMKVLETINMQVGSLAANSSKIQQNTSHIQKLSVVNNTPSLLTRFNGRIKSVLNRK